MSFEVMEGVLITTFCPLSVFFSSTMRFSFTSQTLMRRHHSLHVKDLKVLLDESVRAGNSMRNIPDSLA